MSHPPERPSAASSGAPDAASDGPSPRPGAPIGTRHVLFLCTHNSARSLMAEAILNRRAFRLDAPSPFRAFSAGHHPAYAPHPLTLEILRERGYATNFAKPIHWARFARDTPPRIDVLIELCDPGQGERPTPPQGWIHAEWRLPDPADAEGGREARRAAFAAVFDRLDRWIAALLEMESLDGPLDPGRPAEAAERLARIASL